MAITIVEQSGGQYHVLLIIADGQQVTRSVDTDRGQLSPQERRTVEAIVKASEYPLSIVLVGLGDGPWDMMKEFDDNIPALSFDSFQFVNFSEIMSKNTVTSRKEAEFALSALMEIPSQYKATLELNILGTRRGKAIDRVSIPPPSYGSACFSGPKQPSWSASFQQTEHTSMKRKTTAKTSFHGTSASDNYLCPICIANTKDMAFGCGHQTFNYALFVDVTFKHESSFIDHGTRDQISGTWWFTFGSFGPENEQMIRESFSRDLVK